LFAIGYAVGLGEIIRVTGSRSWLPALLWNAACILAGELAIELGLAPSMIRTDLSHAVALTGLACLALVTRILGLTERNAEAAEERLRDWGEHFESLVMHASDVIGVIEADGRIRYVSPAVTKLLGFEPQELESHSLARLLPLEATPATMRLVARVAATPGESHRSELELRHRDGTPRFATVTLTNASGSHRGSAILNVHDITRQRGLEQQLRYDAMHDPLTATWNRAAFAEAASKACAVATRDGSRVALLYIDLDGFKQVNDSLGHAQGDEVLVRVADQISQCLRHGDILGRLGGDEFAVLMTQVSELSDAVGVAERVIERIRDASIDEAADLPLGASIGIAFSDGGRTSAGELLRIADGAMYTAKRRGRGRWEMGRGEPFPVLERA
jgi:diguanylate cyclase (GGDEF)-like protein/PAS domain S-box-containing protein